MVEIYVLPDGGDYTCESRAGAGAYVSIRTGVDWVYTAQTAKYRTARLVLNL